MAGPIGQSPDSVGAVAALEAQPARFTLFAALRLLEAAHVDRPRLAESRRAADDAVRLAQPPHLYFAPSDVSGYASQGDHKPRLTQYSFGIFGPNGALPLHLTEYAHERERQHEDPTLADFVNTFQHRLISFFYRAWANADPATNFDRPDTDRFVTYVGAFLRMRAPPNQSKRRLATTSSCRFASSHLWVRGCKFQRTPTVGWEASVNMRYWDLVPRSAQRHGSVSTSSRSS